MHMQVDFHSQTLAKLQSLNEWPPDVKLDARAVEAVAAVLCRHRLLPSAVRSADGWTLVYRLCPSRACHPPTTPASGVTAGVCLCAAHPPAASSGADAPNECCKRNADAELTAAVAAVSEVCSCIDMGKEPNSRITLLSCATTETMSRRCMPPVRLSRSKRSKSSCVISSRTCRTRTPFGAPTGTKWSSQSESS
jgi:hypothetical protein